MAMPCNESERRCCAHGSGLFRYVFFTVLVAMAKLLVGGASHFIRADPRKPLSSNLIVATLCSDEMPSLATLMPAAVHSGVVSYAMLAPVFGKAC